MGIVQRRVGVQPQGLIPCPLDIRTIFLIEHIGHIAGGKLFRGHFFALIIVAVALTHLVDIKAPLQACLVTLILAHNAAHILHAFSLDRDAVEAVPKQDIIVVTVAQNAADAVIAGAAAGVAGDGAHVPAVFDVAGPDVAYDAAQAVHIICKRDLAGEDTLLHRGLVHFQRSAHDAADAAYSRSVLGRAGNIELYRARHIGDLAGTIQAAYRAADVLPLAIDRDGAADG